jgi:hypothetical protein
LKVTGYSLKRPIKKTGQVFFLLFLSFGCTSKTEKWIFIMAGQSNMAGRGILEAQDTITDEKILVLNKEMDLVVAKEPLHFYEPELAGLDCGVSFAKELRSGLSDNIEIILVPCAVGGSSIDQWLNNLPRKNIKLYSNFMKRVNAVKSKGIIKGILWHQGESDAHQDKLPDYQSKLEKLIQKFRTDIGDENLTILVGELGEYTDSEGRRNNWKVLNNILKKIEKKDKNVFIISSKNLKSNPDKIHFNSESQRELGRRYAKKFIEVYRN